MSEILCNGTYCLFQQYTFLAQKLHFLHHLSCRYNFIFTFANKLNHPYRIRFMLPIVLYIALILFYTTKIPSSNYYWDVLLYLLLIAIPHVVSPALYPFLSILLIVCCMGAVLILSKGNSSFFRKKENALYHVLDILPIISLVVFSRFETIPYDYLIPILFVITERVIHLWRKKHFV